MKSVLVARGLWRHVVGTAVAPEPYAMLDGVPVLADGKTPATEDEIECKEDEITEFDEKAYLAQHIILSTISTQLNKKLIGFKSARDMWEAVEVDAKSKSALFVLDPMNQLSSTELQKKKGTQAHPKEMNDHPQVMVPRHENLDEMGSEIPDAKFDTVVIPSPPESWHPKLQTVTAAEVEQALVARGETKATVKGKDEEMSKAKDEGTNPKTKIACYNCGKTGHKKHECYSKGGGKEGQAPWQRKRKGKDRPIDTAVVMAANGEDEAFFACTCILELADVAEEMQEPRLRLGTRVQSGTSRMACPEDDLCRFREVGMQDLETGSIKVQTDKVYDEADSRFGDDTAKSSHRALSEGEKDAEKFIQYPQRRVPVSGALSEGEKGMEKFIQHPGNSVEGPKRREQAMDGEVGSHSSCYHARPSVRAVTTQEPDVPRPLEVSGARITKRTAIDSRRIEYSRHVNRHGWDSAHRRRSEWWRDQGSLRSQDAKGAELRFKTPAGGRKVHTRWMAGANPRLTRFQSLDELDWRARKKRVVPDESEANRPYLIRRSGSKYRRCEGSKSYQKGVGKLENHETKVEYKPKANQGRWKRSRKRPECRCKHLEQRMNAVEPKTGKTEGLKVPHRKQGDEKPAALGTSRKLTPKVVGGRCIEYKGLVDNTKCTMTPEGNNKSENETIRVKNSPSNQYRTVQTKNPSNGRPSEATSEGVLKGKHARRQGTESTHSRDTKKTSMESKSKSSRREVYTSQRATESPARVPKTIRHSMRHKGCRMKSAERGIATIGLEERESVDASNAIDDRQPVPPADVSNTVNIASKNQEVGGGCPTKPIGRYVEPRDSQRHENPCIEYKGCCCQDCCCQI